MSDSRPPATSPPRGWGHSRGACSSARKGGAACRFGRLAFLFAGIPLAVCAVRIVLALGLGGAAGFASPPAPPPPAPPPPPPPPSPPPRRAPASPPRALPVFLGALR